MDNEKKKTIYDLPRDQKNQMLFPRGHRFIIPTNNPNKAFVYQVTSRNVDKLTLKMKIVGIATKDQPRIINPHSKEGARILNNKKLIKGG